jgi:hypothetical protein
MADVLRVEGLPRQAFENTYLMWQVTAHAALEDVPRLKRTIVEVQRHAHGNRGWQAVLAYAQAEHQRALGNLPAAIATLESLLVEVEAGEHQLWAAMAAALVRTLDDMGRTQEALDRGEVYWQKALDAGLGVMAHPIRVRLCVAAAKLRQHSAAEQLDATIDSLKRLGTTGLYLALAHEARARVALIQGDKDAYQVHCDAYDAALGAASDAALAARHRRRRRDSLRANLAKTATDSDDVLLTSRLDSCRSPSERARAGLELLAERSHATGGLLYRVDKDQVSWVTSIGCEPPNAELDQLVQRYVTAQLDQDSGTTGSEETNPGGPVTFAHSEYRAILLSHYAHHAHVITGVAVFMLDPTLSFVTPTALASEFSRFSAEYGDVTGIPSLDE